jgi:hypothetical protein
MTAHRLEVRGCRVTHTNLYQEIEAGLELTKKPVLAALYISKT